MKKILLGTSLFILLTTFSANAIDLTLDELKQYNGVNKPEIYVAIEGTIYDVTDHPRFNGQGRQHKMNRINECGGGQYLMKIDDTYPNCRKMLANIPVVGKIITK